jgi:hypothetical protein
LTNLKTSIADWLTGTSRRLQLLISKLLKTRIGRAEFVLSLVNFVICISIVWFVLWYLGDTFSKDVTLYILLPVVLVYLLICTLTFLIRCLNRIIDSGNGFLTFLMLAILVPPVFVFAVFELQSSNLSDGLKEIGRSLSGSEALLIIAFAPLLAKCLLQPTSPKFTEVIAVSLAGITGSTSFKLTIAGLLGVSGFMLGSMLLTDTIWLKRSIDFSSASFYSATPPGTRNIIQCNNLNGVVVDAPETRMSGYSGMSRDGFKDATFVFRFINANQTEGFIDVNVTSPTQSMSLASDGMRFEIENRPVLEKVPASDLPWEKYDTKGPKKIVEVRELIEMPISEATQKIRSEKPDSFTINGVDENTPRGDFRSQRVEKFIFNKINDYGGYQLTYIRHVRGTKDSFFGSVYGSKYGFERTSVFLGTCTLAY